MVLLLAILDGWGIRHEKTGNAIAQAATPHMDTYFYKYPWTLLNASGEDVGLPRGQMGNSEVGHLNIGAGRIVPQASYSIDQAIDTKSFYDNKILVAAVKEAKQSTLHLAGLLGPGGVHSHARHLYALLELAKKLGLQKDQVKIHCFLDGRDTPPTSAVTFIRELEDKIREIRMGTIATLVGRYYAMDRDNRWERIQVAFELLTQGHGRPVSTAEEGVTEAYRRGETDEFLKPLVVDPAGIIAQDHVLIFYNFRADRARQLTRAFIDTGFTEFPRSPLQIRFVPMIPYHKDFPVTSAFKTDVSKNTVGEVLSKAGLTQLRIAETEKYAHVTFFFNGGREKPFRGEDRVLVPSPRIATYDRQPEMSAYRIVEEVIPRIDQYDVIILNFANADMVGHTGILEAGIKAAETIDTCVGMVATEIEKRGGIMMITADHGDLEEMLDRDGKPHTAHTTNPVPFLLLGAGDKKLRRGRLADIAPTMLDLLGLKKPSEMTGDSLIR